MAVSWPILTPMLRVGVNSIFVAVIYTKELVAIDTAFSQWQFFFSPTLASPVKLKGLATRYCCIFKLNISPLILSCRFYESSAFSFQKRGENPKFSRHRHCAKTFTVPIISTRCHKGRRLQYTLYLRPRPVSKCNQWIKTA